MNNYLINPIALLLKYRLEHNLVKSINIVIASNSMSPFLRRGDTVFIVSCNNYEVGDVIAYMHWEKSITVHRIIRITNNLIYTKGDNNLEEDNYYLTENNIIGKVKVKNDD
jgi:signal peptidase I